ncbi:MAG TPA: ferrous iron transport protein A [Candidatus Pullichristensenella avicola]|nr:ferrous iron transport protein A [Candidatus Pullichristensenella avicola]
MQCTLDRLRPGESATVRGLLPDNGRLIARRLMDLGFTRGAHVRCLFAAPSGEPRAYRIRGAVVALRREDAALVRAEREVASA